MDTKKLLADIANHLVLLVALAASLVCAASTIAQEFKFLEVTVFDENAKPMAEVPVEILMDGLKFPLSTNELGIISLNVSAGQNPVELRVRQTGYELQKMRWGRGSEVPVEYTFKMQPGKSLQGVVLGTAGKPIAGAEVFTATPEAKLTFLNGSNPSKSKQIAVITDSEGKFTLPHQQVGTTLVCLSDVGWLQLSVTKRKDDRPLNCQLTPWARVEITSKRGQKVARSEQVRLCFLNAQPVNQKAVTWRYQGVTNEFGKFSCDRVITGRALAARDVPLRHLAGQLDMAFPSHGVVVQCLPSKRVQIQIGGTGRKVTGKLLFPVDYEGEVNWRSGSVSLTENNVVDLALRTAIFEYGKLLSQSNVYRPEQRVPPSSRPNYLVRYVATIQPDGSFEIVDVPPGQYTFSAWLTVLPDTDLNNPTFRVSDLPFTITALEDAAQGPFDLGEHVLE